MTQVVSELLYEALSTRQLPAESAAYFEEALAFYGPQTQPIPLKEAA